MAATVNFMGGTQVELHRPGSSPWFRWGTARWLPIPTDVLLVRPQASFGADNLFPWTKVVNETPGHIVIVWVTGQSGAGSVTLVSMLMSERDEFRGDLVPSWGGRLRPTTTRWQRLLNREIITLDDLDVSS